MERGDLATVVYEQLREIARRQMRGERAGHTLTATALVHEVFLRMAPAGRGPEDAGAFYHAAAQAMRRILIDHARQRNAAKRGGAVGGVRRRVDDIESVVDLV